MCKPMIGNSDPMDIDKYFKQEYMKDLLEKEKELGSYYHLQDARINDGNTNDEITDMINRIIGDLYVGILWLRRMII